jgi:hypothetical protein
LKVWALVSVFVVVVVGFALLCFALLCLQFQTHFYKKKKSWCHGVYPDGLKKSSLFKQGGCHAAFLRNNEHFPWGLATTAFCRHFQGLGDCPH